MGGILGSLPLGKRRELGKALRFCIGLVALLSLKACPLAQSATGEQISQFALP